MKKLILLIAFILFSKVGFCGATCAGNSNTRIEAAEPIEFKRQFARMESSPIEITIEELQTAYSIGKKQINNQSEYTTPIVVNIGIANTTNTQEWSIKNQTFQLSDTLEVVSLSSTGYATNFPNSDFALKRKNKNCINCDEFIFANYQNSGIYLDGQTNFNRTRNKKYIDTLNYIISSLPVTSV